MYESLEEASETSKLDPCSFVQRMYQRGDGGAFMSSDYEGIKEKKKKVIGSANHSISIYLGNETEQYFGWRLLLSSKPSGIDFNSCA